MASSSVMGQERPKSGSFQANPLAAEGANGDPSLKITSV